MKKRKPYYIIIAVLCFAAILNIFLPYLTLPKELVKEDGYILDLKVAALESDVISEIANEVNKKETYIYDIAKGVIKGKEVSELTKIMTVEDTYIYDIVSSELDRKVAELEKVDSLKETTFSFFGLITTSVSIMKHLNTDIINSILLILCMISTIILPILSGLKVLLKRDKSSYKFVLRVSVIGVVLAVLGIISANAISIGALQVEKFRIPFIGIGFWTILFLNMLIWIVAKVASIHEAVEGYVTWTMIKRQRQLILMSIPFVIYAIAFYYLPLKGWTMAFQNFKPAKSAIEQSWVAWDNFKFLFSNNMFLQVLRNTLAMSIIVLILGFALPIAFSLLLNELRNMKAKKFVQTISYLPHFLSWIIVAGIVREVLAMETGIVNQVLVNLNFIDAPINFFAAPKYFWGIIGATNVWKETGWNSIIYLAAITAISPDLYEAAAIDGAGRMKKMLHITLPSIKPTIFILLIINIGFILNQFDLQYLLMNGLVQDVAQTVDIYVMKYGISMSDYSLGTTAGIFKSVVSVILIFLANRFSKSAGEESLF